MTTCLVTGGAGFIGCAVSRALADRFEQVTAIDNLHPQVHPRRERPADLDPRVELVVADICDPATWEMNALARDFDVVLHLAAETGTGQSLTEATRHAHVNVVGLSAMLDALTRRKRPPRRIVLSSSRAVYGEGAWAPRDGGPAVYPGQRTRAMLERGEWDFPGLAALPFEAGLTQARPTSVYGATKLAQEHVLTAWGQAMGVETPILRLQNVYGPGQSLTNPYTGIVPFFARLAKAGEAIPIYEDGEIIRDFVFIDDVARALVQVTLDGAPAPGLFDVGRGERLSIHELGRMISRLYGAPAPVVNGKFRHGDVRSAACRVAATTQALGWRPQIDVETGVKALCAWIDARA